MAKVINDYANDLYKYGYIEKLNLSTSIVKYIFARIKEDIDAGNDVKINGFGTFKLTTRAARSERQGRNPQTGEPMTIAAQPEKQVITFKHSKIKE